MDFRVSLPLIWGNWAKFGQLAPIPQIHKTSINWPSDGIYTLVGLHLMWNVEFNTMNDFLCIGAYDKGDLGPISPTYPQFPKYTKIGITWSTDDKFTLE